jgi:cytochrome c oxidase subunit IV
MRLKTLTFVTAIAQLLSALCGLVSYISMISHMRWSDNASYLLMQPIYLAAHATLVVFLFTLAARQKGS